MVLLTSIKNDYVTNTDLSSKLNDLKSQDIADEVKEIDDKTENNAIDILGFQSRLKQNEDLTTEFYNQIIVWVQNFFF